MKKVLIYSLIVASIIGITISANSFEYKGVVTVRADEQKAIQKAIEEEENFKLQGISTQAYRQEINISSGTTLILNLNECAVLVKNHDSDNVIVKNNIGEDYVKISEIKNGTEISANKKYKVESVMPIVEVFIPIDINFKLDIKGNDSTIDVDAKKIRSLKVESGTADINISAKELNDVYIDGGKSNVYINVEKLNGDIIGRTGIGSTVLDIGNIDDVNINGFRVFIDKVVKIIQNDEGKFDVNITGDLGKVIFN